MPGAFSSLISCVLVLIVPFEVLITTNLVACLSLTWPQYQKKISLDYSMFIFANKTSVVTTTGHAVISLISHENLDDNINIAMNQYSTRHPSSILALWRSIFTAQQTIIFHHKFNTRLITRVAEKKFRKNRKKSDFFTKNIWDPIFPRHVREAETHLGIEVNWTIKETNWGGWQ